MTTTNSVLSTTGANRNAVARFLSDFISLTGPTYCIDQVTFERPLTNNRQSYSNKEICEANTTEL
jgi:hypothetical protein